MATTNYGGPGFNGSWSPSFEGEFKNVIEKIKMQSNYDSSKRRKTLSLEDDTKEPVAENSPQIETA